MIEVQALPVAEVDYKWPDDELVVRLSDYDALAAECERLHGEVSDLHATMMAAAVEIQEHWAAHCDEEGYGPANLMHRLERGIAAQYGYNAETVVCMEAQRDAALAELATVKKVAYGNLDLLEENERMKAELAALKGGQAKDETHAQPEVAQNTGSQAMANNQLQRQGRAAGHGVEAVAAVNEASEASDIFAWATFDGEGSYELRLYENNESYQDEWLARESAKYAGWVFPLYKTTQQAVAVTDASTLKIALAELHKCGVKPGSIPHMVLTNLIDAAHKTGEEDNAN